MRWFGGVLWAASTLVLAGSGHALAAGMDGDTDTVDGPRVNNPVHAWKAVSEDQLDDMRGGFDIPSTNLQISFGIDRAVYINGDLVASMTVNIPDVTRMTAAQAQQLANVVNTVNVVQNGPNNVAPPDIAAGAAAAATVIQNSLNNQTLQAITTINAAVNSLPQFRQLSLGNALQSALANVVTGLH
ncbi:MULTISPECIES: hypothetical protein [Ralstonia]|jgi:hypothetical protein|uniref:Lipoprotein n=1 Tax=Ralstonia flaminis TaxID=3058597 RepID=A0ABM9K4P2_9RALS|nr:MULTISPECIES: hypothetical protein [unclassified Ralstonia]CAJ0814789.1 hypothetical protein LMG18101_02367 [Ralstonia sp. LMG 18101]